MNNSAGIVEDEAIPARVHHEEEEDADYDEDEEEEEDADYDEDEDDDRREEEDARPRVEYIDLQDSPSVFRSSGPVSMGEVDTELVERRDDTVGESCSTSGSQKNDWNLNNFDGLFCPICMDTWTNGGGHQVCCLPCGHLYGFSCIRKWLGQRRSSGKCPQCNRKCRLKDVRKIFASRIATVDQESHKIIQSFETKLSLLENKDTQWCRKEAEWKRIESALRSEISQLKKKTTHLENLLKEEQNKASAFKESSPEYHFHGHQKTHYGRRASCSFLSQGELRVNRARLFDIDATSQILLLARRLSGVGGSYVLTQMSLVPPYETEEILLPPGIGAIKDLRISPNNSGLALFGSLGKKLSILSMDSHNIILSYNLPAAAWSCSWDINGSHQIYAGLQNGMLLVFDMRQTTGPIMSLRGLTSNPVHTLHPLLRSSSASSEASVLSASSIGMSQWNTCSSGERPSLVPLMGDPGVCISSAYCPSTEDMVLSFRPRVGAGDIIGSQPPLTPSGAIGAALQGSHAHFTRVENDSYRELGSCHAWVDNILLPKTAILNLGHKEQHFASFDESTKSIILQELPSFQICQRFRTASHQIHDIKYAHVLGRGLLGCLSDEKVQIFSATLQ